MQDLNSASYINYCVKLLGLYIIINGGDCQTRYRKQDLTMRCLQENYFKYKDTNG